MSGFNAIDRLTEAGIAADKASDEQRAVLASLSEAEVDVLTGISARLNAAGPDVLAHEEVIGGIFW